MLQFSKLNRKMGARNHSKNVVNSKKLMVFFTTLFISVNLWGQTADDYRVSAERGDKVAQNNLGVCYENGYGVTKDNTQAVYWYRKAAEQGYATAQYNLGFCYEKSNGVTKDYTQAVYWYRKAAEQGFAMAQCNLGHCYNFGDGITKDNTQAVYWYRKAAEQGYATAQYII